VLWLPLRELKGYFANPRRLIPKTKPACIINTFCTLVTMNENNNAQSVTVKPLRSSALDGQRMQELVLQSAAAFQCLHRMLLDTVHCLIERENSLKRWKRHTDANAEGDCKYN
jgi:hypothetical protein